MPTAVPQGGYQLPGQAWPAQSGPMGQVSMVQMQPQHMIQLAPIQPMQSPGLQQWPPQGSAIPQQQVVYTQGAQQQPVQYVEQQQQQQQQQQHLIQAGQPAMAIQRYTSRTRALESCLSLIPNIFRPRHGQDPKAHRSRAAGDLYRANPPLAAAAAPAGRLRCLERRTRAGQACRLQCIGCLVPADFLSHPGMLKPPDTRISGAQAGAGAVRRRSR